MLFMCMMIIREVAHVCKLALNAWSWDVLTSAGCVLGSSTLLIHSDPLHPVLALCCATKWHSLRLVNCGTSVLMYAKIEAVS